MPANGTAHPGRHISLHGEGRAGLQRRAVTFCAPSRLIARLGARDPLEGEGSAAGGTVPAEDGNAAASGRHLHQAQAGRSSSRSDFASMRKRRCQQSDRRRRQLDCFARNCRCCSILSLTQPVWKPVHAP
jgi:hypothetical protein